MTELPGRYGSRFDDETISKYARGMTMREFVRM
jgi:hypothetical protein